MNTNQQAQMAAMRAVFQALFDAVAVSGDFDEGKWEDLIAAFNATGRLIFGWPHLESSESDIFGALDDIAAQLEATTNAIEQTTKEARIVMHELHEAIGPESPDEPEEPSPTPHAHEAATETPIEHETREEPPPIAMPSPIVERLARVGRGAEEPVAEQPRAIEPQVPDVGDETLFDVIRADPTISMAAAERAIGMAPSRGIQRMKLLDSYGTLPADIKEWREARAKARGVPKGVNSQAIREAINARTPAPQTIKDALAVTTFEERRIESAREASERTWRERHPEEARA